MEETLLNLIIDVVREIGEDQENDALLQPDAKTRLFGENLNSLGIVFLIAELESRIEEDLGRQIVLADDRAMSQKTSPFLSVGTLARYVQTLLNEGQAQ